MDTETYIVHFILDAGGKRLSKHVKVILKTVHRRSYSDDEKYVITQAMVRLRLSKDFALAKSHDLEWIVESVIKEDELPYMVEVNKEDITFGICPYVEGYFNNLDVTGNVEFNESEYFLLMLYRRTGYMPQYGDTIESDGTKSDKQPYARTRFVIVSKDFAVDDYNEIKLCVVPEYIFYQQFKNESDPRLYGF